MPCSKCSTLLLLLRPENALRFHMRPVQKNRFTENLSIGGILTKQETFCLAWVKSFKEYKHALSAARTVYFSQFSDKKSLVHTSLRTMSVNPLNALMDAGTVTWINCILSQFEIISPEAFTSLPLNPQPAY